jgi:uncharacterized membrane protein
MDMLEGETAVRDYALERLMMLSDGVFAIAMTLLALDLRIPDTWNHTLPDLLTQLSLPFQTFFWSFFSAATFWMIHRRLFGLCRRADRTLTVLNLILLGEITLIPVVTRILTALFATLPATLLYLGIFALIGATNGACWLHATGRARLTSAPVGRATRLVTALIHCTVPVAMTSLGMFSARPGLIWLLALLPAPIYAARTLSRLADTFDRRRPAHATP